MSNNTTTYVPGSSAKSRDTQFGEVIKLSFKAKEFADFVKANANEKGYINLEVSPRKEVGQYGDTHSVKLDNWVPKEGAPSKPAASKPAPKKQAPPEDDIPF